MVFRRARPDIKGGDIADDTIEGSRSVLWSIDPKIKGSL